MLSKFFGKKDNLNSTPPPEIKEIKYHDLFEQWKNAEENKKEDLLIEHLNKVSHLKNHEPEYIEITKALLDNDWKILDDTSLENDKIQRIQPHELSVINDMIHTRNDINKKRLTTIYNKINNDIITKYKKNEKNTFVHDSQNPNINSKGGRKRKTRKLKCHRK
jgi:hypothetical protein